MGLVTKTETLIRSRVEGRPTQVLYAELVLMKSLCQNEEIVLGWRKEASISKVKEKRISQTSYSFLLTRTRHGLPLEPIRGLPQLREDLLFHIGYIVSTAQNKRLIDLFA